MESYLFDWANLLLRWLHVIAAIAWIGSSFYFVFLDKNLLAPADPELKAKGVDGVLWSVHGGGFYHPQKYMVAPKTGIDSKLHWFYWEAYTTWLAGFALFAVMYLWNAGTLLVDKRVFDWSPVAAGVAAVGFLVVFWLVYDGICRIFKFQEKTIGALIVVMVVFGTWLAYHLFSARAAFLISGAMMATAMSANVFFVIIPGQRIVVKTMLSGKPYDKDALAVYGKQGKQRSVHNTYFTLPVVIAMLSNHYNFAYNHAHGWLVLLLLFVVGVLIRQYFVLRNDWHLGKRGNPWPYAAASVVVAIGTIAWMIPTPSANAVNEAALPKVVDYAQLKPILEKRCYLCHGATVQQNGLRFDDENVVMAHAADIYRQVVVTKNMPFSNATQMTDEERALVGVWFKGLSTH
jgi:uncharacterized membrane protein